MKAATLTLMLVLAFTFFLANSVFANCGVCGVGKPAVSVQESFGTISGEIICLGCTPKKEQGAKAQCSVYGHTNGLRTSDGRIWTFLENDSSTKLVNDHNLAGKKAEIKGKIYENANYIEAESFSIS